MRSSTTTYRPDIDGLRAVAVMCVIAFHAWSQVVPGGFIGVDVFFVISGYLICGLILDGLREGTFSLGEFYLRRIRRLFPALALVLAAVWSMGWHTQLPDAFASLGRHILAGAGFYANVLTYQEVGYFDAPATAKPLLHLWSLGVEEQFYLVFPLLLLALGRTRGALLAMSALVLASFALNLWLVRREPSAAFYLPFSRIWEFGIGAALAWTRARIRPGLLRADAGSAVGLVLIGAGALLMSNVEFPGWRALVPALGAALIIASPAGLLNRVLLSHPAVVYVGLISYPLYLWHWPLLVFARQNYSDNNMVLVLGSGLVVALAASVLTYHLVERPIRSGRRLALTSTALAGVMAALAAVGLVSMRADGFIRAYPQDVQALLAPVEAWDWNDFADASNATKHPGPTVVIFGDSHADHLYPGLRSLQREREFRIAFIRGFDGVCGPLKRPHRAYESECRGRVPVAQQLTALKPDIVIVGGFWWQYTRLDLLAGMLEDMRRAGAKRIVVLGSLPYWRRKPTQHLLYEAYRATGRIPERLKDGFNRDKPGLDDDVRAVAERSGATFISVTDILCNDEGCLARLGDKSTDIIQFDSTHLSTTGSRFVVKAIEARVFADPLDVVSVGSVRRPRVEPAGAGGRGG